MKKYNHLSEEERNEIVVMLSRGKSIGDIGKAMGRSKSSISREVKRNSGRVRYRANRAQKRAQEREKGSHKKNSLKSYALKKYVEEKMSKLRWSPEIISGILKKQSELPQISHEAIYQWIYREKRYLINYLIRSGKEGKNYQRGSNHRANRVIIPDRTPIAERPQEINDRTVAGHWETDLIVGSGKSALKVCVERKTRMTKIRKVKNKTAQQSNKALQEMLSSLPKNAIRSITYDNGTENAAHGQLNKILQTASYFCLPYHSWQKGSVENTNGIIRWFLPKKTNFDNVSKDEIATIESWLNDRPRKCLNYLSPKEVFCSFVALAT
jgi:IS30 family transposase